MVAGAATAEPQTAAVAAGEMDAQSRETGGKKELETRTAAVEQALSPLIQQVSTRERERERKRKLRDRKVLLPHERSPTLFCSKPPLSLAIQITELSGECDAGKPLSPSVEKLAEVVRESLETLVTTGEQIARENQSFQVWREREKGGRENLPHKTQHS